MQITQLSWTPADGWSAALAPADLVLAFGPSDASGEAVAPVLRDAFPDAVRVYCSGAGQIAGPLVVDDTVVVTALSFAHTRVRAVAVEHALTDDSAAVGAALAARLSTEGLRHALVFSDGTRVNGSALIRGLASALPEGVTVTGGLAADDDRFTRTLVGLDTTPAPGQVVLVGLYGERLRVGVGTLGGWDVFGPNRLVTHARGNVLHELDGQPALSLYKRYLGPFAAELPASALLFPLALQRADVDAPEEDAGLVRTVLGVDEATETMTFAGDVPEGTYVRLMKASPEALIGGAEGAARAATDALAADALAAGALHAAAAEPAAPGDALALLVSCVGRRLTLRHRTEEELEAVRDALGERLANAVMAGFYSYGEIAPAGVWAASELHNQTMTITLLSES